MEILVLIAVIAVGAAALYVALTFNIRAKKVIDPLVNKAKEDVCHQIKTLGEELALQAGAITGAQQRGSERAEHIERAHGELKQQVQAISDETRRHGELVEHLGEQFDVRQDQLDSDLLQLDHRIAQLIESLAEQSTQISEIRSFVKRQGKQTDSSEAKDSLLSAMLEAESYVDRKGWGQPPHLYALTEHVSPPAADHELADEMQGARLDKLIPVVQEPLPGGHLIDGLANLHWPEDVVGCVLVTELADMPPRNAEGASVDLVAAGQWASTHPDARPARLVVGVCRSGEHKCGLRIKGEDDVHVGTELADDLVTALMGTF